MGINDAFQGDCFTQIVTCFYSNNYFKERHSIFCIFRLVNYQRTPVLECRSIRPALSETEIPTGIELRSVLSSQLCAFLVPVVKTVDRAVNISSYFSATYIIENERFGRSVAVAHCSASALVLAMALVLLLALVLASTVRHWFWQYSVLMLASDP